MKDDSRTDRRRLLKISGQAALALVVLWLLAVPIAIQADLKATAVLYAWDFYAIRFQNSNVIVPWDGTWVPFLHELNFDEDPWPESQGCGPGEATRWAGNMDYVLSHVDNAPPGAPGFQETRSWSLVSCDRNQDGKFDSSDLTAPPSPHGRPDVYAECSSTGTHCRVEPSEQDVVTECSTILCQYEIVTTIRVNLDLNCDGLVDPDLGIPIDPLGGNPEVLCFYAEARTPTLAEQADLVWQPPLQARVSTLGGDKTVNLVLSELELAPSAAFTASPISGRVPLTVTFSDQSSGTIDTWLWDFGDGASSTEASPTHVYEEAGSWDVTLLVSGPDGGDVEFKPDYIEAVDVGLILAVDLQGRTDDSGVLFTAWSAGEEAGSCTSGEAGTCSIPVASGTYSVTAVMGSYLDSVWESVSVGEGETISLPTFVLLGGDVNDDCQVNILDLSRMGSRFGTECGNPMWDAATDINADCDLNILDMTLAGGNFLEVCPVPWLGPPAGLVRH